MRQIMELNRDWIFRKPGCQAETVTLPHTWNAVDGQDGGNDYFRGTCVYEHRLNIPKPADGSRVYIEFRGVAQTCTVSLNGRPLRCHKGGYSTFRVDLTDGLTGDDVLTAAVDNGPNDTVYPQKADFTFYGGLYRSVYLITVPGVHFDLDCHGGSGLKITPVVDLEKKSARVTVEAWANGGTVTFTLAGQTQVVPVEKGRAVAEFVIENVHLWDGLEDPYLYQCAAALDSGDAISAKFGCRTVAITGEGFFLNGRPYPLRGVSRHQDRKDLGSALTVKEHAGDLDMILDMGANAIRLAHYQHAQEFYDLCDEKGLVCWAEIPYITQHMANGRENTLSQMTELVAQNYNHPCIVCWGLSNEITASPAEDENDLLENHRQLNDLCHHLDPSRPTTMANVFMLETDHPILDIPDVNAYNLYFGWYLGELEQNDAFFDAWHEKYPEKPMGFSEYGADANPRFQSGKPAKGDYTETYQCVYHEHILRMIEARPWLWCSFVWNMFDFAADGRDEGGKRGENQKGLVTFDRKTKKDAFWLYKAHWSKEPFVHLCGKRYVNRCEDETEIKVYSNQPRVSLMVDGMERETKAGDRVFTFTLPLTGTHTVTAKCGALEDTTTVRKAEQPDPDYVFGTSGDVENWFDKLDPDCYSIKDTFGTLMADPRTGAIVGRMMEAAIASRGDVAKAANQNAGLQRMMASMTLEGLLKQAGDAIQPEQIRGLNAALQKIKKG